MEIQFLGGADTVTGSQHLIQVNGNQLLRDCGLFQGKRKLANEYNRELLFNPANLDALLLSHAHVDHCGNIPSAVAQGYEGPIYATTATAKLCEIMLQDAAKIQEQDAEYLNQKTSRRGLPPVEPLYRTEDALKALQLFRGHDYGSVQELVPGITSLSLEAGHILGSELSVLTVTGNGRSVRIGFAVDLGREGLPIIRDPELMEDIDVLIIESTYGNRTHGAIEEADSSLGDVIRRLCVGANAGNPLSHCDPVPDDGPAPGPGLCRQPHGHGSHADLCPQSGIHGRRVQHASGNRPYF